MWAALMVAAVALAGVAFMLRFLVALLREAAPSVCYWVVPVRPGPVRESLTTLSCDRVGGKWRAESGLAAVQVDSTARRPTGITVRPSRQKEFPDIRILVRMKKGPPGQSC
jgi:hypothetical protein